MLLEQREVASVKRGNINGSPGLFCELIWDPFIQESHHLS